MQRISEAVALDIMSLAFGQLLRRLGRVTLKPEWFGLLDDSFGLIHVGSTFLRHAAQNENTV